MFVNVLFFVIIMLAMLIPGYVLRKVGLIKSESTGSFVALLLYICAPMLIFKSLLYDGVSIPDPTNKSLLLGILLVFVLAIVVIIIAFFAAKLIFLAQKDRSAAKAYVFAGTFGNVGFIGIPFVQYALSGDPNLPYALLYTAIFNVVFNTLCWTLGVYIITGDMKSMKPIKILLNPIVIVAAISLPLFFLKVNLIKYVSPLADVIVFLGTMTTPLSMIIVGIRLAEIKVLSIFTDGWAYLSSFARLIVAPLLAFGLVMILRAVGAFGALDGAFYLTYGKSVCLAIITMSALPAAASTIAFCQKLDGDVNSAVKGFMNSTFLALVTLPILLPLLCSCL